MPAMPISLTGCRRCGIEPEGHDQFYALGEGWHPYGPPPAALTFARILARRASRTTTTNGDTHA